MNVFKKLLKSKKVLAWAITTVVVALVIVAVNVVTTVVLPDLINGVLGGERAMVDPNVKYRYFTPDFENKEEALDNGTSLQHPTTCWPSSSASSV